MYTHAYIHTDVHRTPAPGNLSSIGLAKQFGQVTDKLEQAFGQLNTFKILLLPLLDMTVIKV